MKALLLAGGLGTRLRPLTLTRPKHLLPIANRAHIEHVLDLLVRHEIREVVLTTSYLADAFSDTVARARERGVSVEVTHEETALGTAGALKNAEGILGDDTFLVFNGDVLTDVDLIELVTFHRDREAEGTILLTPVEDPSAFGVVPTASDGRVTGFIEKPPREQATTNLINAGVYVLEPSVLKRIPERQEWSVERSLFPELVADGSRLFALATDAYWMDVGTPDNYLQVNLDALTGRFAMTQGEAIAAGVSIDPSAAVSDCCLGAGCRVETGARLDSSVLLPGVVVGERASVERCVLGENAVVAAGARLIGDTVGDGETVGGTEAR